jgi:hypothetical protein
METPRTISMTDALSAAWLRMKLLLFRPFNLELWLAAGFAAFLQSLGSSSGTDGLRFSKNFGDGDGWDGDWTSSRDDISSFWDGINWEPWVVMLAGFMILLGIVLMVLFLWLSSRGSFIFLDNLVTGKGAIREPWSKYRIEADSLFGWRLVFTIICFLVFGAFTVGAILVFLPLGVADAGVAVTLPAVILFGALGFALAVAAGYIEFFLQAFVVPLMYRDNLSASQAWSRFIPLFQANTAEFVIFGIFYLLISIVGGLALGILGFMTCCIGLVLLALPYIGSVVSLPLTALLRYWTVEYLGRFGEGYDLLGPIPSDPDESSIYDDGDGTVV